MNKPSTPRPQDVTVLLAATRPAAVLQGAAVHGVDRYSVPSAQSRRNGFVASVQRLCRAFMHRVTRSLPSSDTGILRNLYRSLRGRSDWQGHPRRRRAMMAKYLIRVLSMPLEHGRYLAFIQAEPAMNAYRRRDPRMLQRHLHRYMNVHWDRRTRLRSLSQHYQFALRRLPMGLFKEIYVDGHAALGELTLKDGSVVKLCLRPPIPHGCEGELCIQLGNAQDHPIYRVVLSVIDDQPTLAIGCIQGPDGESAKDVVRDLTRNMYGLRPKQLMLALAYAFAHHYRIRHLLAVANVAHPLRKRRDRFRADYDAFWVELSGRAVGNGWFELPGELQRKSEADVPSNHRSAFRRREALRVEAEQIVLSALAASSTPGSLGIGRDSGSVQAPDRQRQECKEAMWKA